MTMTTLTTTTNTTFSTSNAFTCRELDTSKPEPVWLDKHGHLEPKSCEEYDAVDEESRRIFCHIRGRYLLPTIELVLWLTAFIDGRHALEIGAGAGDLGRALGIKMVDNYQQRWRDVAHHYKVNGQPTVPYGSDVAERDANAAVRKWKPQVVIGAWITEYVAPWDTPGPGGGNIYGVKEDEILKDCEQYVLIGSEAIHGHKKILELPHFVYDAPFVRSRRSDNKIWVWPGERLTK